MPTDTTAAPIGPAEARDGTWNAALGLRGALRPVELGLVLLTIAVGLLCVVLSFLQSQAVAWGAFLISFAPSLGLVLLGAYLRQAKDMPRAAMAAIAAGIYIGFSGVITILIYLRFPFDMPLFDAPLMRFDAWMFGYDWASFTTWLAQYPGLGKAVGWIYGTSLLQLFVVIFVLGFHGRARDLSRLMITGVLSLLMAVAIWWAWPSFGPSAHVVLPHEVELALNLVHGEAAGARMLQMAAFGNTVISPDIIMGTIAFPSYHTVMACMAVVFTFGTLAFWPMVLLNIGMLPAILAHGGHHLTDMIGGFMAFALAYRIATWLADRAERDGGKESHGC